jgi:hypothetical protein
MNNKNKLIGYRDNTITVRYMAHPGANVISLSNERDRLVTDQSVRFAKKEVLIIADCKKAEILIAKEVKFVNKKQMITLESPLQNHYEEQAVVSRFIVNHYYVADTKRVDRHHMPIYSLFVRDVNQHKTELISGINELNITYTIRKNGRLQELEADQVDDWGEVVGVGMKIVFNAFSLKKNWYLFAALRG